jgi:hypothetical protein
MSDKLVEVAAFNNPVEAHAARGLLEAEGIRSVVEGEELMTAFAGIQSIGGRITLNVAECDAVRAVALLADVVEGPPPDDSQLWLCPLCDDAVDIDEPFCPSCRTARPETWQPSAAPPDFSSPSVSEDIQAETPPDRSRITSDAPIEDAPWARENDEKETALQQPSMQNGERRPKVAPAIFVALIAVFALGLVLLLIQIARSMLR